MTILDEQQILDFKQNGYLILRDFIDSKIIDQWRCQFWQQVGGSLEDPTSWSQAKQTGPPKLNPQLGGLPDVQSIVFQLGSSDFSGGGCGILTRWPRECEQWQMPQSGHLDGYPGEGCQAVLMVGLTTYLYDVGPGGGSFTFWPGSHHDAHTYFLQHPEQIEGTFRDLPAWEEQGWSIFCGVNTQPPQEFVGQAGDVILWHGWLTHTGSANVRPSPRIGLFARWVHKDDAGVRKNLPQSLWDYWAV